MLGDFALNGGAHDGGSISQVSGQVGGRFAYLLTVKKQVLIPGSGPEFHPRLQFFVQALAGMAWVKTEFASTAELRPTSERPGSSAPEIGLDFLFSDYGGLRGQVDWSSYLSDRGGTRDNFFRFSIGVVYRFEHDPAH